MSVGRKGSALRTTQSYRCTLLWSGTEDMAANCLREQRERVSECSLTHKHSQPGYTGHNQRVSALLPASHTHNQATLDILQYQKHIWTGCQNRTLDTTDMLDDPNLSSGAYTYTVTNNTILRK